MMRAPAERPSWIPQAVTDMAAAALAWDLPLDRDISTRLLTDQRMKSIWAALAQDAAKIFPDVLAHLDNWRHPSR